MTRLPPRTQEFKEQTGYLTIAQNGSTDYLELAYLQALSIKATQKRHRSYAVLVDTATRAQIEERHLRVFDYVIDIPWGDDAESEDWKLSNEWKVWWSTPFKETVKLDADLIFTTDVDHWWPIMQIKDVCLCTTVRDRENAIVVDSPYRRMYGKNNLINAYSAFSYFRYSQTSAEFFSWCAYIFKNWSLFRDRILVECYEERPTTDTVYAIAATLTGKERCYLPGTDVPSFVHMKGGIQGWDINEDWTERLNSQITDRAEFSIGTVRMGYPVHYHIKDFANEETIEHYRRILESRQ